MSVCRDRGHPSHAGRQSRAFSCCSLPALTAPVHTANLFLLISSILGSKTAGTHTQFVQWFMEECVDCLEQGSHGSILQFMPFTMVSPPLRSAPRARDALGMGRAWGECGGAALSSALCSSTLRCQLCSSSSPGFRVGESVHHVQSQNRPGHHRSGAAPGPPRRCQSHRCTVSMALPLLCRTEVQSGCWGTSRSPSARLGLGPLKLSPSPWFDATPCEGRAGSSRGCSPPCPAPCQRLRPPHCLLFF